MGRRILYTAALFMILIVVMLPVCFASANGDISNVVIKGKDSIPGFLGSADDYLEVTLDAKIIEDGQSVAVEPSLLRLTLGDKRWFFTSCTESGGVYSCTYKGNSQDWLSKSYQAQIDLFHPNSLRLDSNTQDFYVDGKAPAIASIDVPGVATGDDFSISYSVKDTAVTGSAACIGLSRIDLLVDGKVVKTKTISESYGRCADSGGIETNAAALYLEEGENEVCMQAYDFGGLYTEECFDIYVDYNPPVFEAGTFMILGQDGNEVRCTGSAAIEADIYINITDAGISAENVIGDFSELYPDSAINKELSASECNEEDGMYQCVWENVRIYGVDGDASILFTATDDCGNTASYTESIELRRDDDMPVVEALHTYNDDYLNKSRNTIVMEIRETGSGMAGAKAYLDLNDINPAYSLVKADSCTDIGDVWECYFNDITVSGLTSGQEVYVRVNSVMDDIGLEHDRQVSIGYEKLIYDDEAPEILNVTVGPYRSDYDILMEDDVAEITAVISDDVSGVSEEKVYADYSGFDPSLTWTEADSCIEEDEFICTWNYGGSLPVDKTITINVRAMDNAGNIDKASGSVFVAKRKAQEVDFWEDEAAVTEPTPLNPNFLWQQSGTIVRVDVSLDPKRSSPYVHMFKFNSCKADLLTPDNVEDFQSLSIKSSYYYSSDHRSKLMLLELPSYKHDDLAKATGIEVICTGEVMQASSARGPVYEPNEIVNATFTIPLMTKSLFTDPTENTVNKINANRKRVESYDKILEFIDGITSWLEPICTTFTTVRSIINNVCVLMLPLSTLLAGFDVGKECPLQAGFLESVWYGEGGKDAEGFGVGSKGDFWHSNKNAFSLGFWCDLVVCEDCNEKWSSFLGAEDWVVLGQDLTPDFNEVYGGLLPEVDGSTDTGAEIEPTEKEALRAGSGRLSPSIYFDPFQSIIVAVICWPPCLKGIENKITVLREIEVTYNVCMNTAAVRGLDTSECDKFHHSQICQQILGEFWNIADALLMQWISKTLMYFIDYGINYISEGCEWPDGHALFDNRIWCLACVPKVLYAVAGWWVTFQDTRDKIEQLGDMDFRDEKEGDVQEHVDTAMDLPENEYIDRYGNYPDY